MLTPLLMPKAAAVIRAESCGACKFSAAHPSGRADLVECRIRAPIATIVPGPNGQPVGIAAFAPMQIDQWCGEWKPKIVLNGSGEAH